MSFITLENVSKIYKTQKVTTNALKNINLKIEEGEFVTIIGDSGSGKTTILNLIGALDRPTNGNILVDNKNIGKMNNKELNNYRANVLGIVFQNYNLINNLSVLENIMIMKDIKKDIADPNMILNEVGLSDKTSSFPLELSGGQSQRVAIARALVKQPKLLLCDEPTGALDYENSKHIIALLRDLNQKHNMTTILVKDGEINEMYKNEHPISAHLLEW